MTPPPQFATRLLAHASFVRRLASDLVADPGHAEDLSQEVMVRALQRPPRHETSLRGWLARITRRLWSNELRAQHRRRHRERTAATAEALPDVADVLAQESARDLVVQTVLRLDEPFRSAVLLRYYEGLEPKQIAAQLGIPAATVRSRVARGLQRLRRELDRDHDGDRRAWIAILGPCLRPSTLLPAILVKKLALAATVLIASLLFISDAWRTESTTPTPPGGQTVGQLTTTGASPADPAAPHPRRPLAADPETSPAEALLSYPADRPPALLRGIVLGAGGRPLAGVQVQARPHRGHPAPLMRIAEDRDFHRQTKTDQQGHFEFSDIPAGPLRVSAQRGSRRAEIIAVPEVGSEAPLTVLLLQPQSRKQQLRVMVVDHGGTAVAGAAVELFGWTGPSAKPSAPSLNGKTASDGSVTFPLNGILHGMIRARGPAGDLAETQRIRYQLAGTVRMQLQAPGQLQGVIDGPAAGLEGAEVALLPGHRSFGPVWGPIRRAPVQNRRFAFAELPPGAYGMYLVSPAGLRLQATAPLLVPEVKIQAAQSTQVELQTCHGATIQGQITHGGHAVAGAEVRLQRLDPISHMVMAGAAVWRLDHPYENAPDNGCTIRSTRSDAQGKYRFTGLLPGPHYGLIVGSPGLSADQRPDFALEDGKTQEFHHRLQPAGVLHLATTDVSYLGVRGEDSQEYRAVAVIKDGCATIPGLPAGRYVIARLHSDPQRVPPVELARTTIEADRSTWLDLRRKATKLLRGVVRSGDEPLADALLVFGSKYLLSDARGAFQLRMGSTRMPSITLHWRGMSYAFAPRMGSWQPGPERMFQTGSRRASLLVQDTHGRPMRARIELQAQLPEQELSSLQFRGRTAADGKIGLPPVPVAELRGKLRFADGYEMPLVVPVGMGRPQVITRPQTLQLRVTIRRAGKPLAGQRIQVGTWTQPGLAASDQRRFLAGSEIQTAKTDAQGQATLQVRAGTALVFVQGFMQASWTRRLELHTDRSLVVEL